MISLQQYRSELEQELQDILAYWMKYTPDQEYGGFAGKIDHDNIIHKEAPKGAVLNSRILWSFSAAARLTGNQEYAVMAGRAYRYICDQFIDKIYGGIYWTVDYRGNALDTKKQVYAQAFAVYGLSEYYRLTNEDIAKKAALALHEQIIIQSYEKNHGGYIEALTREWGQTTDLRLSAKDANEKKSMNTHLHVLEAFTSLYRIWPDEKLKQQLTELVNIFLDRIISPETAHLILFFNDEWDARSNIISYGHDVEAAWLVQETAALLGDEGLLDKVKAVSVQLVTAAAEGLDKDGGLWYEYDAAAHHLIKQKHSWPQAEAMIGFFNAWQITGKLKFLEWSMNAWQFVKKYMHDKTHGEWYWGVHEDHSPMLTEDKAGLWKCPYHNSRACMELIDRITTIQTPLV